MHRFYTNFAIYILVDHLFCGENFGFLPHCSAYFPHPSTPQLGLESQLGVEGGGGAPPPPKIIVIWEVFGAD